MSLFTLLLVAHVCIAGLGLCSGFVALVTPKGGYVHLKAGDAFVACMLVMTSIALCLAIMHRDLISIVPSILTFYLVATGWAAVSRKPGVTGRLDFGLLAVAMIAGSTGVLLGLHAALGAAGQDDQGFPAIVYFIFASIAFFAAGLDGRMLIFKGVRGRHRLARHLWRMSAAMFIATTSFFQGQEQVFPTRLQGTLFLKVPAFLVIGVMLYWLARLMIARPPKALRPQKGTAP